MPGGSVNKPAPVVTVAAVCVAVLALYASREFLIPLVFSALVTWILLPMVLWLEKRGMRRGLAVAFVTLSTYVTTGGLTWIAVTQLVDVMELISSSHHQLSARFSELGLPKLLHMADRLQVTDTSASTVASSAAPEPRPMPVRVVDTGGDWEVIRAIGTTIVRPIAIAGFASIIGILVMLRWEDVRDRIIRLVSHGRIALTTQALEELSESISRVLRVQVLINVGVGLTVGACFHLLGVPMALLWGVMAALLRFVPIIGPIVAGILPGLLTLATGEGWIMPLLVTGIVLVVELAVGNFIEPKLLGKQAGVSTVALLVAAAFWTWIWGLPGLLLATPITVGLAVLGRHVPHLSFLELVLGEKPALTPAVRLYQRVVALDRREAGRLTEQEQAAHGVEHLIATMLSPAVHASEAARQAGEIEPSRVDAIFALLVDLVEAARTRATATSGTIESAGGTFLCIPARNEADEACAAMLATLLVRLGVSARWLTVPELGDLPAILEDSSAMPRVACICAASEHASRAARLRQRQVELRRPGIVTKVVMLDDERDGLRTQSSNSLEPANNEQLADSTLIQTAKSLVAAASAPASDPAPA